MARPSGCCVETLQEPRSKSLETKKQSDRGFCRQRRSRQGSSVAHLDTSSLRRHIVQNEASAGVPDAAGRSACATSLLPKTCEKCGLTRRLNRHLTGWKNYFDFGYPRQAFREINTYVRDRLTQHLRRRSQRPFRPPEGVGYYDQIQRFGLVRL